MRQTYRGKIKHLDGGQAFLVTNEETGEGVALTHGSTTIDLNQTSSTIVYEVRGKYDADQGALVVTLIDADPMHDSLDHAKTALGLIESWVDEAISAMKPLDRRSRTNLILDCSQRCQAQRRVIFDLRNGVRNAESTSLDLDQVLLLADKQIQRLIAQQEPLKW